jgi:hypothetical protein
MSALGTGMSFGRELAKLSDAELAARLERAWAYYETSDKRVRSRSWFWSRRRTVDLPLVARIWAGFHRSPGFRLIHGAFWGALGSNWAPKVVSDAAVELDDHIGEIQAIIAEIKRRVERRKVSA